jgi:hypothetical protein
VDFIISRDARLTPIEVKWAERPPLADARHVVAFLRDHPARARRYYVICRCESVLALSDQITGLPWLALSTAAPRFERTPRVACFALVNQGRLRAPRYATDENGNAQGKPQ